MAEKKLHPMFEDMSIDNDTKIALNEEFEKAVLNEVTQRMDEYVEKKVQEKTEVLEEEYKEKKEYLVEALDGYLDTVVEEFVQENAPIFEAQIQEEKTKTLLEAFDTMVKVLGVDMLTIKESKDENSNETKIQELEESVSDLADRLIEAKREADSFLKKGLVQEMAQGLTVLETEKFEKLAEMVEFSRDDSFVQKLETIKESITSQRSEDFKMDESELPKTAFKQPEVPTVEDALNFNKYL